MSREYYGRMMTGLFIIAIGIVFLLHQTEIIHIEIGRLIADWWPVILIFLALKGLLFSRRTEKMVWNLILLAFGLYFLGWNLNVWRFGITDLLPYIVPLALIVAGIGIILKPNRSRSKWSRSESKGLRDGDYGPGFDEPSAGESGAQFGTGTSQAGWRDGEHGADAFGPHAGPEKNAHNHRQWWKEEHADARSEHAMFGDLRLGGEHWTVKPLNTSRLVGDTFIDLTKADIPAGETRFNLSTLIGDIHIQIPDDPDLEILVDSSSILGAMTIFDRKESGFLKHIHIQTPQYEFALKRLRIHASTLIGDFHLHRVPSDGGFASMS